MLKTEIREAGARPILQVPHVVRGRLIDGLDAVYTSRDMGVDFATPAIDPDALVWTRREPLPMLNMPIAEILDFLVELGARLDLDTNASLQQAFEGMNRVSALGPRVMENIYRDMRGMFNRRLMEAEISASIGSLDHRFAFIDLLVEGRWGGLVTGDQVTIDFSPTERGVRTPVIRAVDRYKDLPGDDKATCAGTIDAYVRGALEPA